MNGFSDPLSDSLRRYFGYEGFLDHQRAIVEKILAGENLCVVMPTGAGKSLCYQLPILLSPGYGLIVSPLIALMADQVAALRRRGIPAAFINSSIGFHEQLEASRAAAAGEVKLLYVAPERLQTDFFQDFLQRTPPSMLIVDEAHCISEWGHDFRPSCRMIGPAAAAAGITRISAFTATATPEVCRDIAVQLQKPEMKLEAAGFRRPNLSFKVKMCEGGKGAKLQTVAQILKGPPKPTLIYAATRQAVEELSTLPGVRGYHAGMSIAERNAAQEYFMNDPAPVLAATNAFGMGIDRPDVRRVIHYQLPGSLEAYYQEAGRAGRDGEAAECLLLFSYADCYIQNFLIEMNNPPPAVIRSVYRILRQMAAETPEKPLEVTGQSLAGLIPAAKSDGQISAALGILEKCGAIRRSGRQGSRGELTFTEKPETLRILHQEEKTQRSRFLHRVAARYQQALTRTAIYSVEELSRTAGLSEEQTKRVLAALNGDVLTWQSAFSGRTIELTDPEMTEVPLDDKELFSRLQYEEERLETVVQYARTGDCRQRFLIEYFGEKASAWQCGCCDNCDGSSGESLAGSGITDQDIRVALRAADFFNGRIGIGKLGQILAGSRNAGIVAGNWHRNPCFGALKRLRASRVEKLLRALENSGDLERIERGGYPCIRLSAQGREKLMAAPQDKRE